MTYLNSTLKHHYSRSAATEHYKGCRNEAV